MKTKFLLRTAALICFFTMIYGSAFSEDFLFKTVLVKQVNKTITPTAATDCNGDPVSSITPYNYTITEVMKTHDDFSLVSFRVYYSDDLSTALYSFLSKTSTEVSFNSTTGQIAYTMTGIAKTRKKLTVRVYLNDGSGAVYETKDFFTSQASNLPPVGTIIPYYGVDDNGTIEAELNLGGWFFCDGSSIGAVSDNILYPDEKTALQSIIGGSNFPDLRGLFLRGAGTNSYDPSSPRGIGSIQTEQTGFTAHNYDRSVSPTGGTDVGLNVGTASVQSGSGITVVTNVSLSNANHTHTVSTTTASTMNPGGGIETRPDNAAVMYLIKARK